LLPSTYTTRRLKLTSLAEEDGVFILELLNTEGWKSFIGDRNVTTLEEATSYIKRINAITNCFYKVVRLKADTAAVGIITFMKRDYLPHFDIGFAFLPQYSNKGYAFEAASAVLSGLENNNAHAFILATTVPTNIKSILLLKKLGFQFKHEINIDAETLKVYELSNAKLTLDKLIQQFYSSFNNINKKVPNLTALQDIFITEPQIIKKEGEEYLVYNLTNFLQPREKMLQEGTLCDFEEKELSEETRIVGNIAQRFSCYKKSGTMNKLAFKGKGNKLFQFVKTTKGWKIAGFLWEDETNF
jgi:RimJ/RimL family protein N-acetyltransferase